jgi:hypothetical protein
MIADNQALIKEAIHPLSFFALSDSYTYTQETHTKTKTQGLFMNIQ